MSVHCVVLVYVLSSDMSETSEDETASMAERLAFLLTDREAPGSNLGWSNFLKSFSVFINVILFLGC